MFKYNISNPNSIYAVADWVELFITFTKNEISKTQLGTYLEFSSGNEPSFDFINESTLKTIICHFRVIGNPLPAWFIDTRFHGYNTF